MLEQKTNYNCASLCSLCEGEEVAKKIYITRVLMNYRNEKQYADDYCFGTNRYVSFGFGRLQPWDFESERF